MSDRRRGELRIYVGLRRRRRQDLRDVERGPTAPRPRHRRRGRLHRDPWSPSHRRAGRRPGGPAPPPDRVPRFDVRGDGCRRAPRSRARGRAGRRARAHERAGLPQRETLAGRRGAARGGHRRDLDGEHPAPRVGERRRRAHHRGRSARDDPRRDRPGGRPAGARRHDAARAASSHGARQHLPAREGRRRARQLLPRGEPRRPPGAGAPVDGRPRRRVARTSTCRPTTSKGRGRRANGSWSG